MMKQKPVIKKPDKKKQAKPKKRVDKKSSKQRLESKIVSQKKKSFFQVWAKKIKTIKIDWAIVVVIFLAAAFFVASSLFNYYGQQGGFVKWTSPDETANYQVAKLYAQTNSLMYFEEHNEAIDELMHPRSYRSDYGYVKPVSFLGMPLLYGKIGHILGIAVIPYLTQFFAALSIIFFFLLIRRLFNQPVALLSVFFLASFPVYLYYASRSMFHNLPFISFLIIGLYFATVMVQNADRLKTAQENKKKIKNSLAIRNWSLVQAGLAGLFLGMATTMRTSELIWLGPLLVLLWLLNVTRVGLAKLLLVIAFFVITFVPVFYWNNVMYGGPFNTGYSQLNTTVYNITISSAEIVKSTVQQEFSKIPSLAEKLRDSFFFFGFKAEHALKMFYHYFYQMFGWLFWLAIAGGITFFVYLGFQRRHHWAYILAYFIIFPILLFYYGSWVFYDNPDPNSFTIGNSYTRYWLPLYLGVMPFAALAIVALTKLIFRTKYLYNPMRAAIVLGIMLWSAWFVAFGSEEGLVPILNRNPANRAQYQQVLQLTEPNAVIITTYHDKLFHPQRKVIVAPITDRGLNQRFAKAVKLMPVYYYSFTFPEKDLIYLNDTLLRQDGLGIRVIKQITEDFTLYKVEERK